MGERYLMGIWAEALRALVRSPQVPFPTTGSFISPMSPTTGYLGYSRAYMRNEIVFAAIEMLATSAGEPHIIGRRWQRSSPTYRAEIRSEESRLMAKGLSMRDTKERMIRNGFVKELPDHPLIRLLNNPNPFMSRGQMWGTVVMDRALAGNAYLLKARLSGGLMKGTVAELWRLRPDRVKIIPDANTFISGYEYRIGRETVTFPPEDVMHFKTRNPLNDYYGMPPLMAIAGRVDIDEYQKTFLRSFFERGGVGPGSILSVKQSLKPEAKEEIRKRFKERFGGSDSAHEMLILDAAESTYTQMGLNRGLRDALPKEINAMQEARLAMAFGIPHSILGTLIGTEQASYANKRADHATFWSLTMTPLLSDLDDVLNLSIVPDFGGIDEVMFDLSDIYALREDVDKLADRWRKNLLAGMASLEESREAVGLDPNVGDGTFYVPSNAEATEGGEIGETPEPPASPAFPEAEPPASVAEARCPGCKRLIGKNVTGGEFECPDGRCKEVLTVGNDGRGT